VNYPVVSLSRALESAEVFVDGDWIESKDQDPDGDVRLIQLADVGDGEYVDKSSRFLTSAKARALRCTFLQPGDVLVARMPDPLGRACIFPGDRKAAVTVVDVCVIRPNREQHDARWLMHCLNAPDCRNQMAGFASGTTRSRISRSNLARIEVTLPPLTEQRRIAEVLDRAEALRAKRRAVLAQFDALSQAIFFDLFGDHRTNSKAMRTAPLGELIKLKSGEFLPATAMVATGKFPVFGGNGINGYHDQFLYEDEKIVIGRVGAYCGCIHVCPPQSWVTDNAMCVSERSADVELGYLAYSLKLANLNQYASQSGQPLVSGSRIYPVEILVPPLALQQDFARRIAAVDKLKAAHRASLAELDALFAALQHRAFRGEL
jgi:type I restriction enzyme S subunit